MSGKGRRFSSAASSLKALAAFTNLGNCDSTTVSASLSSRAWQSSVGDGASCVVCLATAYFVARQRRIAAWKSACPPQTRHLPPPMTALVDDSPSPLPHMPAFGTSQVLFRQAKLTFFSAASDPQRAVHRVHRNSELDPAGEVSHARDPGNTCTSQNGHERLISTTAFWAEVAVASPPSGDPLHAAPPGVFFWQYQVDTVPEASDCKRPAHAVPLTRSSRADHAAP